MLFSFLEVFLAIRFRSNSKPKYKKNFYDINSCFIGKGDHILYINDMIEILKILPKVISSFNEKINNLIDEKKIINDNKNNLLQLYSNRI